MTEFTTAYEIGNLGVNDTLGYGVYIAAVAFGIGMAAVFFPDRTKILYELRLVGGLTIFGGIWLFVFFISWRVNKVDAKVLLQEYRSGQSRIAEGVVHVTHEQFFDGHSAGDKITVGSQEFEINGPGREGYGYSLPISHGGLLREGVLARLHYRDGNYLHGVIYKVEIGIDENSQQSPLDYPIR